MALPMSPLLPQNDPDSSERKNELVREQEKYQYNYTYLPPLAMSNSVPFKELREILSHPNAAAVEDMIREALARIEAGLSKGDPSSLNDYNRLFKFIALPAISQTFEEDAVFARMRVAGPNPLVIERVAALNDQFPVTNEQYQAVMGEQDHQNQKAIDPTTTPTRLRGSARGRSPSAEFDLCLRRSE